MRRRVSRRRSKSSFGSIHLLSSSSISLNEGQGELVEKLSRQRHDSETEDILPELVRSSSQGQDDSFYTAKDTLKSSPSSINTNDFSTTSKFWRHKTDGSKRHRKSPSPVRSSQDENSQDTRTQQRGNPVKKGPMWT